MKSVLRLIVLGLELLAVIAVGIWLYRCSANRQSQEAVILTAPVQAQPQTEKPVSAPAAPAQLAEPARAPQPTPPVVRSAPPPGQPKAPPPPPPIPSIPVQLPAIPRHYPHIRIAALAYERNPMGAFEDQLLRQGVDLVVPHKTFVKHIHQVSPNTPQLLYTNTSNLYLNLFLDWLSYADAHGIDREEAFYHARQPVPFKGDSPSSKPVAWFWSVLRGGRLLTDITDACGRGSRSVSLARLGEAVYIGYPERFREINLTLDSGAADGWAAVLEYPTANDEQGRVFGWSTVPSVRDKTKGLSRSGCMGFDPPAGWKAGSVGGSERLFFVRLLTHTDGTAPRATAIRGRDYVQAGTGVSGTVPVFDSDADADKDGYLNDAEYARRAPGKDARFRYESRMFTANYGQMRFAANPASAGFRQWVIEHHRQFLSGQPLASGLFMDNVDASAPVRAADVHENVETYAEQAGQMIHALAQALSPRWVLMNIGNQGRRADPLIRANPIVFQEFAIRPLAHHYAFFEELAGGVAHEAGLTSPPPYVVLDSYSRGGSPTDPRTQLATLAYYYLLADPDSTFLMFEGGNEPSSTWTRHWSPAAAYNVGKPTGKWSLWASGADPANAALQYRVYQRPYERGLVLYKPLSFGGWRGPQASIGDQTGTTHQLERAYRPLRADGTLGESVKSVWLRNGEGAILLKGTE